MYRMLDKEDILGANVRSDGTRHIPYRYLKTNFTSRCYFSLLPSYNVLLATGWNMVHKHKLT